MFAAFSLSRCRLNLIEYLLLDCTLSSALPVLHQHLSVMKISCTTSQMATEHLTKLIFLLGTWGSGDVFGVGGSFSPSKYKWPFQFQPLEVIVSSGVQVQNALVMKTLRHQTTVEQGICLLHFAETSPSIRVSLADGLQAQSKAGQREENLQRQLQGLKKWKKERKKRSFSKA